MAVFRRRVRAYLSTLRKGWRNMRIVYYSWRLVLKAAEKHPSYILDLISALFEMELNLDAGDP
jgi:hypothetical protein